MLVHASGVAFLCHIPSSLTVFTWPGHFPAACVKRPLTGNMLTPFQLTYFKQAICLHSTPFLNLSLVSDPDNVNINIINMGAITEQLEYKLSLDSDSILAPITKTI